MWKYIFLTFMLLCPATLPAQELYTDYLQKKAPGRGRVVLHQSKAIADLVNGTAKTATAQRTTQPQRPAGETATAADSANASAQGIVATTGQRVRANGYRIQVFSGGNSRAAKTEANNMEQRVRSLFPDIPIYTQFISPHWKCRIGDFRTYEEANEVFTKLKETQRFREAVIVKSKINVYY